MLVSKITEIIKTIWKTETIPEEWKTAIICPIFKKGNSTKTENYRGISLLDTCYKILTTLILERLNPYIEEIVGNYQCGFRRGKSTTDHVFALRQIMSKYYEFGKDLHLVFVDYKQAYDSVEREELWKTLIILGIPKKYVKLIKARYEKTLCKVCYLQGISDPFEVKSGLKQGDALSPALFNLALEKIIRDTNDDRRMEISNEQVMLAYADDIMLMGETKEEIINSTYKLINAIKGMGLHDGFYHCELDEESTKLCTFSSPFGSYSFKRLPFGISMAPELFQKRMSKYFGDIEGIQIYFDDVLICANSREAHDQIMMKVLDRARFVFNMQGVMPDPERIKIIKELSSPTNKKQLQSFLGMINYLRAFIPNLSEIITPFREVLKKNILWNWSKQCETVFNNLKEILCEISVLKNYDGKDKLEIQCDASKKALLCLNESEISFAQIEKEMLAISFKFHSLIYGKQIKVYSDHYLRIKFLLYDIDLDYLPGKYMYIADSLSRNFIKRNDSEEENMSDVIHTISKIQLNFKNNKESEFIEKTKNDEILEKVLTYCKEGWPKICKSDMKLKDKTSETIIDLLMDLFNKFGIPNEIISDNMPFGSVRFSVFAKEWNFKLTQSSPYCAESNGLAEKGVGIAKDMLKKNQPIYVQDKFNKLWKPAIIVKKLSEPRSYLIKTKKGKNLRRNSGWIKKRLHRDVTATDEDKNGAEKDENINKKRYQKSGTTKSRGTSHVYFGEKIMFLRLMRAEENGKYENMFWLEKLEFTAVMCCSANSSDSVQK
ncbi:hypothetical protein QTP88_017332 [Uroleucon formosanum]